MTIKIINVNEKNLGKLMQDPSVYVLSELKYLDTPRMYMEPIKDARAKDILSEENLVIRIETE